jgi:hypothetical protein
VESIAFLATMGSNYQQIPAHPNNKMEQDYQWEDLEDDKAHRLWKSIMTPNKAIFLGHSNMHHPENDEMQQYLCNALHHTTAPAPWFEQRIPCSSSTSYWLY